MPLFKRANPSPDQNPEQLDQKIARIQSSTKTTIPGMIPVHDSMRQRFGWYYKWHLFPYASIFHWFIFIVSVATATLVIFSGIFVAPQPSKAAVGQVRPNADNNTLWAIYDFNRIKEVVVQPNAGDTVTVYANNADNNDRQQYDMGTIAGVSVVTSITLWVRAYSTYDDQYGDEYLYLMLNFAPGGTWQAGDNKLVMGDTGYAWYSYTVNGSWTQAQLDGLLIGLTAGTGSKGDGIYVDVAYCDVTYAAPATYTQAHYRFRDDTTALNTSGGWLANEDTGIGSVPKNTTRRLRVGIYNDGDSANQAMKLRWRLSGGSWADLAAAGAVKWALSDRYANNDGTQVCSPSSCLTQQGSSTWVNGSAHENATTTSTITFGDGKRHTEFEWAWQFDDTASGTYEFKVVKNDGSDLNTYSFTPSASVAAVASYDQKHFIVRNDSAALNTASGSLPTGVWATDEDDNVTNLAWNTNYRIRIETANTSATAGNITRRLEYNENGAGWTRIEPDTGNVRLSLTDKITEPVDTTSLLTATGTFTAGQGKELGSDTTQISLSGNYYTEDEYCIAFQPAAGGKTYQFRITNAGAALNNYSFTPQITVTTLSVSGYSNMSSGTVAVAVDDVLQSGKTGSITGAGPEYTWTISGLVFESGAIITVWVDGAAPTNQSTGVTKYDGSGNITGMRLNQNVLTVGSDDTNQSLTVANLGLFDRDNAPPAGDSEVMHTSNSGILNVDGGGDVYDNEGITIAGVTLEIGATETLTTVHIGVYGTLTSIGAATYNISGNWDQNWGGVFTAGTANFTIGNQFFLSSGTFNGSSGNITVGSHFNLLGGIFNAPSGSLSIGGNFDQSSGTFVGSSGNITVNGTFTLSGGAFTAPSATLTIQSTFNRSAAASFTHNSGTVLFLGNSNYTITTNNATFNNVVFNRTSGNWVDYTLTLADGSAGSFTVDGNLQVKGEFTATQCGVPEDPEDCYFVIKGSDTPPAPTILIKGNLDFPSTAQSGDVAFGFHYSSDITVDLKGNFVLQDSDVASYVRINFNNTTADQNITQSAGWVNGPWSVAKGDYSAILTTDVTCWGWGTANCVHHLTVNSGTFNISSYNYNAMTYDQTGGTFTGTSGLVRLWAFYQSGGTFTAPSGGLQIGLSPYGTFNLSNGTFNAPSGNFTFYGDAGGGVAFNRTGGTFNANGGTVIFVSNSGVGGCSYSITTNNITFANVTFDRTLGDNFCVITTTDSFQVGGNLKVQNQNTSTGLLSIILNSLITISGNLEFPLTAQDVSVGLYGSLDLAGDFVMLDSNAESHANINFNNTSADQNITVTAGSIPAGTWTITKNTYSAVQTTALSLGGNLTLTSGKFYTKGKNLTINGTFSNNATLKVNGNETLTFTRDIDSGTVEYAGDADYTVYGLIYGYNYWHILISGSGSFTAAAATDVNGNFTQTGGTFVAPGPSPIALTVAGNLSRTGGTFNANGGRVILDGGNQSISGSFRAIDNSAFYDISKNTSGANYTLTFEAGGTFEISNSVNWTGTAGNLLYLHSSNPPNFWYVKIPATKTLNYLSVKDSDNSTGVFANPSNSVNEGHTLNWFPPNPPTILDVSNITTTSMRVNWQDNSDDETGFKVQQSTAGSGGPFSDSPGSPTIANATYLDVSGLQVNTRYWFRVASYIPAADSAWSTHTDGQAKYTLANPPGTPTLTAGSQQINVVIDINSNPDYTVFAIACNSDGTLYLNYTTNVCGVIADTTDYWRTYAGWDGGAFTDIDLGVNEQHTYRLLARNGDKVNTDLSNAASRYTWIEQLTTIIWDTIANNSLTFHSTTSPSNITAGTSGVSFDETVGHTGATDSGYIQINGYTDDGLSVNVQYCYRLNSRNGDSAERTWTAPPECKYTLANVPSAPTQNSSTNNSITMAFNAAGNPNIGNPENAVGTAYRTVWNSVNTFPDIGGGEPDPTKILETWTFHSDGDTVVHGGLGPGETYYYWMQARNGDSTNTDWSPVGSGSTLGGDASKLLVALPGQSFVNGTGIVGLPNAQSACASFNFSVYAVNPTNFRDYAATHNVSITSSDPAANLPANQNLVAGLTSFSIILNTSGIQSVTASAAGLTSGSQNLTVSASLTSAANSTVLADPTTLTVGNYSTVTITLRDCLNPVAGHAVILSSNQAVDQISYPLGNTTNSSGQVIAYVYSDQAHTSIVTAIDQTASVTVSQQATITFVALPPGEGEDRPPQARIVGPSCITVDTQVTFDGRGSTDDHGITDYVWNLGDGTQLGQAPTAVVPSSRQTSNQAQQEIAQAKEQKAKAIEKQKSVAPRIETPKELQPQKSTWDKVKNQVSKAWKAVKNFFKDILGIKTTQAQGTGPTVTHTYSETGWYTVTLTVYDAAGQSDSTSYLVPVCPPSPAITQITRDGNILTVSGTAIPSALIDLYFDDGSKHASGNSDASGNFQIEYDIISGGLSLGSHSVYAYVTDSKGMRSCEASETRRFALTDTGIIIEEPEKKTPSVPSYLKGLFGPGAGSIAKVTAPIAIAAIVLGILEVLLHLSLLNWLLYLYYLFTYLLEAIGGAKRRKNWGQVYDSKTKAPVFMAIVRLIEAKTGRIVETKVTGKDGYFGFVMREGDYYVKVNKGGYKFPSLDVASGTKRDDIYDHVYHGEEFHISASKSTLNYNIPVDSLTAKSILERKAHLGEKLKVYASMLRDWIKKYIIPFLIVGVVLSLTTYTITLRLFDLLLAVVSAILLTKEVYDRRKLARWGIVYDSSSKKPIKAARVKIFDVEYNRVRDTKITDETGHFGFLTPAGQYKITVEKDGYKFPSHQIRFKNDGKFHNVYHGEEIPKRSDNELILANIPIDKESLDITSK